MHLPQKWKRELALSVETRSKDSVFHVNWTSVIDKPLYVDSETVS
jgi:hypothetical protein